jgi:hypothetical protein
MEAMSKKPPMPEPSAKVFYMLGCLECGDPDRVLLMSFASPAERGHWGSEHIKATGHDRWIVIDQPDDDPRQPAGMAFTCPRCGMTSGNPDDEREGYCVAAGFYYELPPRAGGS